MTVSTWVANQESATTETDAGNSIDLLWRAQQGDAEAFCQVVRLQESRLLRQALAFGNDLDSAEDLVQETLIEAWKNLRRYNGKCRLFTWLYAIMLACNGKMARKRKRQPFGFSFLAGGEKHQTESILERMMDGQEPPDDHALRSESAEGLRRCLERLPEKNRTVVCLRFYGEASLEEIAATLGCSIGTVKSRLFYALERLRAMKIESEYER